MPALLALLSKFAGPFGWIFNLIAGFFWNKAEEKIAEVQKAKADHAENVAEAAQDTKKAKEVNAKPDVATEKETDDAIDDMFKHF